MNGSVIERYWTAYGGLRQLFTSPVFYISILITFFLFPIWNFEEKWWEMVLSIMPNVLGFSLGGYAMWMAIGDDNFRELISGIENEIEETSPYMNVSAKFAHFIVVQILSIIAALFNKSYFIMTESSDMYFPTNICISFIINMFGFYLFMQ